jgi:hypothetical protein
MAELSILALENVNGFLELGRRSSSDLGRLSKSAENPGVGITIYIYIPVIN